MQDEKDVVWKFEDDALADATGRANDLSGDGIERWIYGAKNEWTEKRDALEPFAGDVALECLEINNNVRKFRQD